MPGPPPSLAEIAVPVPLPDPLTYRVPQALRGRLQPGCRVRVPVGHRKLVGVVMALTAQMPEGVAVKEVDELLDREPVLPADLLDLARFIADYYMAPIGEAVRALVPADLPPWGDQRLSLTDRGALAPRKAPDEAAIIEVLLRSRRLRLAELQRELPDIELGELIASLRRQGKIKIESLDRRRGVGYEQAVELGHGEREALLAACGRSPKGRAVVEHLATLGRPATVAEVTAAVGCGASVVGRLVKLGVLRSFTQPQRISLERHRLSPQTEPEIVLRADQQRAVITLQTALRDGRFAAFLLTGMTGGGKTEVYLRLVDATLEAGRTAILLVPEIALVPALAQTARARFGRSLAILHSNLSSAERRQEWERVRSGEARIVLGPRSAIFAPLERLGVIVVDEEHDGSYKQDATPRYNGRDLALLRARQHDAVAVLVSATPSLESRLNVERSKLRSLRLTARAGKGTLPEGILVDLRGEPVSRKPGEISFSARLRDELEATLAAGDQIILLRNRRGYAPLLLCRACGEDFRCEDCGLPHTYHRRLGRLICHYCGAARPVPATCPTCAEAALEPIGAGTERVEETFRSLYPDIAVDVLDADVRRRAGGAAAVLERFGSGDTQVLIGTQMVAKGHHFPRVALAAVLFADTYLGFPDFRAVERTYALLTQLAGRAGRGSRPGRVVIQTYHPDHYAIRAALEHDEAAFVEEEMRFRRVFHYPPYTRMVQLLTNHKERERAAGLLDELSTRLLAHPLAATVRIVGPAPAPLERLRGKWRYQLLVRGPSGGRLRRLVREVVGAGPQSDLTIDVDPYDLL